MISPAVPASAGVLESELLRKVLDTIAHDLGGLASALALRADIMPHVAPEVSAAASTAIANELRSLGAQLRELSGPRGGDTLSPTPAGSLTHWFALISRFAQPLLAPGAALRGHVLPVQVGSVAVHELTYITLALLHAIHECVASQHTEVRIASDQDAQAIAISISLRHRLQSLSLAFVRDSDWTQWAQQRAARAHIGMHVEDTSITLRVALTNAPPSGEPVAGD